MIAIYSLCALVTFLVTAVIFRTLVFKGSVLTVEEKVIQVNQAHAVESLSQMIQYKTISYSDASQFDQKEFSAFRAYLRKRYPKIAASCECTEHINGILFYIRGKSSADAAVLMAHYDVVPVNGKWRTDPFSGEITERTVYGRGALDTKISVCAIMEAVESALAKNEEFQSDLYIAFSGDEEVYGPSAAAMRDYIEKRGVRPSLVLDEGGAVVAKVFPGVMQKAAVIGVAEKGFLNIKLTARSNGGHASTPPKRTPVDILANAVVRLQKKLKLKLKMTIPVKMLFDSIAPHSISFAIRMIFSNLWLFLPLVKLIAKLSGGEMLAMFKTTQAFTLASASEAINVLPACASIGINYRLRPFESSDKILKLVKKTIADDSIEIEVLSVHEPSTVSAGGCAYKKIERAVAQTWPGVIAAPYLMVATSDSRHYHSISDNVYKFSPMDVSKADLAKIHGVDEEVSIENVGNAVRFYCCLLQEL